MSQKTHISLQSFYIFNANYGPKEGEEEKKILFYYPQDTEIDTQIRNVGLSEAIIKFTTSFTTQTANCQVLRTQKTIQIFYQPEPDYWMVISIIVPCEKKKDNTASEEYTEYKCDDVHDKVFQQIIKQSYSMFRLFLGTFVDNVDASIGYKAPPTRLIEQLNRFYSKYLLTINLQNCDILNVFRSIQYLALDQFLFLRVHNFIQMIEETFPIIKHCIFLYNERLVWSEINPLDLYSIYEYLTGTLFPKSNKIQLRGGSLSRLSSAVIDSSQYASFITGPAKFQDSIPVPKVNIYNEDSCSSYHLIVYQALSATLCMFVEDTTEITDNICHELHVAIGPQLSSIGSDIGEKFMNTSATHNGTTTSAQSSSDNHAENLFLFFNEYSLKHRGTLHLNTKSSKQPAQIPLDVMNLIVDVYKENDSTVSAATEETILKTLNDYWIVRRCSNGRHFFVVIHKSSTLLEVAEEAKRLFDEHANGVFLESY